MLKQTALIFGLGLTMVLAGCAQKAAEAPTPAPAKTESSDAEKPSDRPQRDGQRGDGQRGDGQRGDGQRGDGQRGDGQFRTPPEAAYTACASLAAESACTVETPRGTRDGVCRTRPGDERAFCAPQRPDGARGGRGEGRPRPGGQ